MMDNTIEYRLTLTMWKNEDGESHEIKWKRKTATYILPINLELPIEAEEGIIDHLFKSIKALKPEQKKGKWITPSRNPEYVNKEFFSDCSVCGFTTMDEKKECPNCGAYMETDK